MLRKDRWRLILMIAVIAVSAFVVLRGSINLGLDLRGGAHIVLQARPTASTACAPYLKSASTSTALPSPRSRSRASTA